MGSGGIDLGDLNHNSFLTLWEGDKAKKMVAHIQGRLDDTGPKDCGGINWYETLKFVRAAEKEGRGSLERIQSASGGHIMRANMFG